MLKAVKLPEKECQDCTVIGIVAHDVFKVMVVSVDNL